MNEEKIKVLIVDDHSIVRQGVRIFLETQKDIEVVDEADSGENAIIFFKENTVDVVLLDLMMSGIDGVETTRQIKQKSPNTNIIILTSFHDDSYILPAIKAGALSYILKEVSSNELVDAVRKAAENEAVIHPRLAVKIIQSMNEKPKQNEDFESLSQRETEVLKLIAEGLSNAKIGEKLFISEKTVKFHVSNILAKLQLADRTQVAVYAWRSGIVE
ncbi:MAG: response regulator transcription factor [Pyrinomonadaceae bacterium]|jgi:two-component system, NarL family, response regulator LiaR|nr:response regulator transcription factor [Pyrinomonadaceae bacterium]